MGTIIQIVFGENMDEYKLGEGGITNIMEIPYGAVSCYDVLKVDGTIERIIDIKRVTYKKP